MCVFNIERYRKISGLKSLMMFIYIVIISQSVLRFGDKQESRPHSVMCVRDTRVRPTPLTDQTHQGMYIKINKKIEKYLLL